MVTYILSFFGVKLGFDNKLFRILGLSVTNSENIVVVNTPMPGFDIPATVDFRASSDGQTSPQIINTFLPTQQVEFMQPTYTPLPTHTPYPQQSFNAFGEIYAVGYSYYWPPFGPPNCGLENWKADINFCEDMTGLGVKWSEWVGRAVAIPIQWAYKIPLGSYIRVMNTLEMQGDYLVIDYCGGCIKPEGHIYFDFLDNRQRLAWTVPLLVQVVSVPSGWPTSTPTPNLAAGTSTNTP